MSNMDQKSFSTNPTINSEEGSFNDKQIIHTKYGDFPKLMITPAGLKTITVYGIQNEDPSMVYSQDSEYTVVQYRWLVLTSFTLLYTSSAYMMTTFVTTSTVISEIY